ncbi:hypothetical protein [Hyalangium gracile]|uniref:hypothetical protein n=1 Tax=Hyalangium gracile TaxID=394092 RepID=UPI001CCAD72F|nr:hypothetical protein [Hyalangium gracile]
MSPRILPALALAGLLTGCGQGPHLEGSVTPLLDLHYEKAEALADEDEASVRFLTAQGSGENTILKVAARLDRLQLTPGTPIDLAELLGEEEDAPQRGTVSRSVLDEPARDFPRILRGTLTFDGALTPAAKVPGSFHVTFVNGTDVYSGRTIFGRFEATVP